MQPTLSLLSASYEPKDTIRLLRQSFRRNGYVKLPSLISSDGVTRIAAEIAGLESAKVARDFMMPGYNTPRIMHTIGGITIRERSAFLCDLYRNVQLIRILSGIVGAVVRPCAHQNEFMVMNFLQGVSSTHGWHLDDPQLALVLIFEAPPPEFGGSLEYVAQWREFCRGLGADSERDVERLVAIAEEAGQVRIRHHATGEAYLLKASECLHRVRPLRSSTHRRVVINMGYETGSSPKYGETANLLYG